MEVVKKMKIKICLARIFFSWKTSFDYLFIRALPLVPSRHVRLSLLRCAGAKIESNVSMFAQIEIREPKELVIGSGCSIGPKVLLDARSGLRIGENATIAYESIIWTLHHDMNSADFRTVGARVTIGDYAWICSRAIILPGVTVGEGAVVASGAVVTQDVEPYSVVGGVPAKKIGQRNKQDFKYVPHFKLHIV